MGFPSSGGPEPIEVVAVGMYLSPAPFVVIPFAVVAFFLKRRTTDIFDT